MSAKRKLAAIMFSDIAGYTSLMQNNEEEALKMRKKHRKTFNEFTGKFHGEIIQYFGDGTLSIFSSSVNAVNCAIEIQKQFREDPKIPLRIAIHIGDIIVNKEDVIGDAVNITARIESVAEPGSILISDKVFDDIKNHQDFSLKYLGSYHFKNVKKPVPLYALSNEGLLIPDFSNVPGKYKYAQDGEKYSYSKGGIIKPVGRNDEINTILDILNDTRNFQQGVLFIRGIAGVGKSSLIRYCLSGVNRPVIQTQAYEDISTAYGPIIEILRALLKNFDEDQKSHLKLISHLGLLLPELRDKNLQTDDAVLLAAIQEVFWKVADTSGLIIFIEDIHWADAATLNLIPKLMDPQKNRPLIILATYREDLMNKNQKIRWLNTELRRKSIFSEVQLKPLTREETIRMVEGLIGNPISGHLADIIYERTSGLPLFIEEITKTLSSGELLITKDGQMDISSDKDIPLPDTINDLITLQLESLSEESKELLELTATLGLEFDFDLLYDLKPVDGAIDEVLEKNLIYEIKPGVGRFRHTLILEAIRKNIGWTKRKRLNRKVAEEFEKRKERPDIIAEFWSRAGEKKKARYSYFEAAQQYCSIHAHWDAAKLADKALKNWPEGDDEETRVEVLKNFANCMKLSGQLHVSMQALMEILKSKIIDNDPGEKASIYRNLASSSAVKGQWNQYREYREMAAKLHEQAKLFDEASMDWRELSNFYTDSLNLIEALKAAENSLFCARKSGNKDLEIRATSTKSYLLSMTGKYEEGIQTANEALDMARSSENVEAAAFAYRKLAGVYEYSSNFNESARVFDSALSFCQREDLSVQTVFCLSCMTWILFRLGDWQRADEFCRDLIQNDDVNDSSRATSLTVMGLIKMYRGELKTAHRYINQAYMHASKSNFRMMILIIHWAQAGILEFEGKHDESFTQYLYFLEFWRSGDDKHDVLSGICASASFFAENDHPEELIRCVDISSLIAEETGNPEATAMLSYTLGLSSNLMKRYTEGTRHLKKAVSLFEELEIPLQKVYAQYNLGKALLNAKMETEAFEQLKQALKLAKNIGARPFCAKIEHLLVAHDEVGTERRSEGHHLRQSKEGLTSRQYEILQAMSKGLSNKEIATKLFISTRTVDMHVSNILGKFNCRNRVDAIKYASEKKLI